jgi:hypothetical protein
MQLPSNPPVSVMTVAELFGGMREGGERARGWRAGAADPGAQVVAPAPAGASGRSRSRPIHSTIRAAAMQATPATTNACR